MSETNLSDEPFDGESARSWASGMSRNEDCAVFPDSHDYPTIRALVEQDKERFQSLRSRMAATRLRSQMRDIRKLLSETIARYTRNAWRISPIRRLPDEILGHIFDEATPNRSFAEPQELTTIRLTCTKWDRVACAHAPMWTNMEMPSDVTMRSLPPPEYLETWLHRSKKAKIAVSFNEGWVKLCSDTSLPDFLEYFRPLAESTSRWFLLKVDHPSAFLQLMGFLVDSLYLKGKLLAHYHPAPLVIVFPSLHFCRYVGDIPTLSFRALSLTALHLKALLLNAARLNLLSSGSPNIEKLVLENVVWTEIGRPVSDEFQFPKVITLVFWAVMQERHESRNRVLLRVLHRLVKYAPKLRSAIVVAMNRDGESGDSPIWHGEGLLDWKESFESVEELHLAAIIASRIRGAEVTSETVAELTSQLPHFVSRFPKVSKLTLSFGVESAAPAIKLGFAGQIIEIPHRLNHLRHLTLESVAISASELRKIARDLQISYDKALKVEPATERNGVRPRLKLMDIQLTGDLGPEGSFVDIAPDVEVEHNPSLEMVPRF